MAPKRGQSLEPSEERTEFFKKLEEYHEKRGYVAPTRGSEALIVFTDLCTQNAPGDRA